MSEPYNRPLKKDTPYYISGDRMLELVHFCRQYYEWKEEISKLNLLQSACPNSNNEIHGSDYSDATSKYALRILYYQERIQLVEQTAKDTSQDLWQHLLIGVTGKNGSYNYLKTKMDIPCCADVYYNLRRKFFWILSQRR